MNDHLPWLGDPSSLSCPIRILMVADGALHFGPSMFGLKTAVAMVEALSSPLQPVEVVSAHRGAWGAMLNNFRFDQTFVGPGSLANFDQVWLFGHEGSSWPLDVSEVQALSKFMEDRGGVFATGDHDEMGAGMGAQIPRVRSMRRWTTADAVPSGFDVASRIDT